MNKTQFKVLLLQAYRDSLWCNKTLGECLYQLGREQYPKHKWDVNLHSPILMVQEMEIHNIKSLLK